jgi:hypothetical protein
MRGTACQQNDSFSVDEYAQPFWDDLGKLTNMRSTLKDNLFFASHFSISCTQQLLNQPINILRSTQPLCLHAKKM